MNFADAVTTVFKKYATVSGRASRSEYWFWVLFVFIVSVVLGLIDGAIAGPVAPGEKQGAGVLGTIFSLATLVPYICVGVRRLHDTDKTGWFLLINIIPIIGWIIFIVWAATKGTPGDNKYGPDPLAATA